MVEVKATKGSLGRALVHPRGHDQSKPPKHLGFALDEDSEPEESRWQRILLLLLLLIRLDILLSTSLLSTSLVSNILPSTRLVWTRNLVENKLCLAPSCFATHDFNPSLIYLLRSFSCLAHVALHTVTFASASMSIRFHICQTAS